MGSHNTHFRVFISSIGGHAVDTGACRIASNEKYLFPGIVGGWGWLLFAVPAGRIIEANDRISPDRKQEPPIMLENPYLDTIISLVLVYAPVSTTVFSSDGVRRGAVPQYLFGGGNA